jgi:hypothetical protein
MSQRLNNIAKPGSLFKVAKPRKKLDLGRSLRKRDDDYLARIRECPCLKCGKEPSGEAAHVRMTLDGKPMAGMSSKPDDKWTLPLCHTCHMDQHSVGELTFWHEVGIDPIKACLKLQTAPGAEMRRACLVMRSAS